MTQINLLANVNQSNFDGIITGESSPSKTFTGAIPTGNLNEMNGAGHRINRMEKEVNTPKPKRQRDSFNNDPIRGVVGGTATMGKEGGR